MLAAGSMSFGLHSSSQAPAALRSLSGLERLACTQVGFGGPLGASPSIQEMEFSPWVQGAGFILKKPALPSTPQSILT